MAVTKKKSPGALGEVAAGLRHRKEGDSEARETQGLKARQGGVKERQESSHTVACAGKQSKQRKGSCQLPRGPRSKYTHRPTEARRKMEQEVVSVGGRIKGSFLCFTENMLIRFCFVLGLGNRNPGESR